VHRVAIFQYTSNLKDVVGRANIQHIEQSIVKSVVGRIDLIVIFGEGIPSTFDI